MSFEEGNDQSDTMGMQNGAGFGDLSCALVTKVQDGRFYDCITNGMTKRWPFWALHTNPKIESTTVTGSGKAAAGLWVPKNNQK